MARSLTALALSPRVQAPCISCSTLPYVLKYTVDSLNGDLTTLALAVPISLIVAYGTLRLLNVLLGEVRDTLFGRVTERAMRRLGLKVFKHLHNLDLGFHLNRRTGGLSCSYPVRDHSCCRLTLVSVWRIFRVNYCS